MVFAEILGGGVFWGLRIDVVEWICSRGVRKLGKCIEDVGVGLNGEDTLIRSSRVFLVESDFKICMFLLQSCVLVT